VGWGWRGLKLYPPPYKIFVKFLEKMAFLKKFLSFLAKNAIFSENVRDLWRFSQICSKILKKILNHP
jgi:hypothetical protein